MNNAATVTNTLTAPQRRAAWIAAALIVASAFIPNPAVSSASTVYERAISFEHAAGDSWDTLPLCATEDSDECVWYADVQGNGAGASFYTVDGVTTYIPTR